MSIEHSFADLAAVKARQLGMRDVEPAQMPQEAIRTALAHNLGEPINWLVGTTAELLRFGNHSALEYSEPLISLVGASRAVIEGTPDAPDIVPLKSDLFELVGPDAKQKFKFGSTYVRARAPNDLEVIAGFDTELKGFAHRVSTAKMRDVRDVCACLLLMADPNNPNPTVFALAPFSQILNISKVSVTTESNVSLYLQWKRYFDRNDFQEFISFLSLLKLAYPNSPTLGVEEHDGELAIHINKRIMDLAATYQIADKYPPATVDISQEGGQLLHQFGFNEVPERLKTHEGRMKVLDGLEDGLHPKLHQRLAKEVSDYKRSELYMSQADALEFKEDMLSMIRHDINMVLTSPLAFARLVRDMWRRKRIAAMSEEQKRAISAHNATGDADAILRELGFSELFDTYVEATHANTAASVAKVHQLMEMQKMIEQFGARMSDVFPGEIVQDSIFEAVETFNSTYGGRKNITVQVNLEGNDVTNDMLALPSVIGNNHHLRSLIRNLLFNGILNNPDEDINFDINFSVFRVGATNYLRMDTLNTGKFIPADMLAELQNPKTQNVTSSRPEGSGRGLSTFKNAAKRMHRKNPNLTRPFWIDNRDDGVEGVVVTTYFALPDKNTQVSTDIALEVGQLQPVYHAA